MDGRSTAKWEIPGDALPQGGPCQNTARQMAKQRGCNGSWDELGSHLVSIVVNAGMSLDDLVEKHEYLNQRDMIPVITNETF